MTTLSNLEKQIATDIAQSIKSAAPTFTQVNVGKVVKVSDGIVTATGLSEGMMGEIVTFTKSLTGMIVNLKSDEVGIIVLGDWAQIHEGDNVTTTGNIASVEVDEALLGRVVNPLVADIDGKGKVVMSKNAKHMPVEKIAPGIIDRQSISVPLLTGLTLVDSMIPVGRGQRELIIGDRNTGKTAIAIDTIINQSVLNKKGKRVISIYVAIGQKQSKVAQVVDKLESVNAMGETIVVSATAGDPVAFVYLAPYVGCAIAEYFMDRGEDVLIVYDDLTKHAWAYRQISLILRRPSGREAYPGDVFYLHSRLLERACRLNESRGGGSITALPIIETQAQDISAYIPTNVISITDGQIYLESDLFYQGVRPAVNAGLSVSRVGGAAQVKAMKQVAGKLRLDLAQFNELAAFAQFGSDLDSASKARIERGKRIVEILKQPQYEPVTLASQIAAIWLLNKGYLDSVAPEDCRSRSFQFAQLVERKYPEFGGKVITDAKGITKEVEEKLTKLASSMSN